MPPVAKAGGQQFRKDVEFVTKDEDEQLAAGIVMVPDAVDLQYDFVREETIREFAEQFEAFVEAGQAGGGIMHAVFPDDWMALERNEVLEEPEEIGGETVDAGAWVQEWRINNADLWQLILDGILSGYSIGAIDVDWNGPFEQDELEDVHVPEEIGEDALVWELVNGIIREVSAVDIPAVPDAQILETKADAEKRLGDYLGDPNGFLEEALERGHTETEAERLWDVLNEAIEVEGSSEPGKMSFFERIGKAAFNAFTGTDDTPEASESSEPSDVPSAAGESIPRSVKATAEAVKEGRTLSTQNRDSLFATIDAAADVLEDAGVDHGITRFTDRDEWDFNLSEHQAREWPKPDEDDENEETDVSPVNNAAGGETPDPDDTDTDTDTTDMTDENPDDGEDKSLAEQNAEQISELTQAVESLTEAIAGPEPKTAEIEIDGETYEVPEDAAKAALGVDEDAGVGVAEAIERLEQKAARVDEVEQRLDTITQQSGIAGQSQQLEASAETEEGGEGSGLDSLGKALS